MTDKPEQCTHLVANAIARTPKFLQAIGHHPFIVNLKWVKDCVKEGGLLGMSVVFETIRSNVTS